MGFLNLRLCGFRDKGITLFNGNEIPQMRGFEKNYMDKIFFK